MVFRFHRARFMLSSSLGIVITILAPGAAHADCTADSTGQNVSCTGSSAGFSSSTPNTAVVVTSGATITGTGVQAIGAGSSVDTTGTINTGAATTAISVGGGGTVTQESAATGAITGNILFAAATGAQTNTLTNLSTTYGIAGVVTTVGNSLINNSGVITGNISQTNAGVPGTVVINNLTGATITGTVGTQDATALTNNGTIAGSIVTAAPTTIVNSGTITGAITANAPASGSAFLVLNNSGTVTGNITQSAGAIPGSVSITNQTGGTLSGNIAVADSLNFSNSGTYTGAVNAPAAAFATIANAGTMTLQGSFTGAFTNSGILATGSAPTAAAPALLTVTGNFVQTGTGTLNVALASSAASGAGYGQIHATGTAALAGTIALVPAPGFYPTGSPYNVVLADQGIIDNGVTVTGAGAVSPFLSFTSNGIVSTGNAAMPGQQAYQFTATRAANYAAVLAPTATPNQLAVASGFQPLVTTASAAPTGDAATLVGGVDYMTIAQAQTFFDQVSPEGYRAYVTALQDQGILFSRQISLRLDTIAIKRDLVGLWLQPYYERGKTGGAAYGSGQDISGISGGYDVGGEIAHAGLAVGYSNANVSYNIGSLDGHDDSFQVAGYGGLTLHRFKADLQLGYVNGKITATKTITVDTATRTAKASTKGHLFNAVGTVGYDLGNDDNEIQPFVGVDASTGSIDGFTETGATTADLTVKSLKADRTDVIAGLDYARKSGSLQPYLHVDYRRDLQTPNGLVSALFNADPSTAFTVSGTVPARSQEDVNLGVRKKVHDDNSQVFIGYQGTFRQGLNSHGINAGLFVTF